MGIKMKKIIKILLMKINALNTLHKTYKKCVCIISMNQKNNGDIICV